ncbi:E3 ubiquitin- ligase TRAIP [Brachionus plicatilis]|uniref:E3 ubiquitin-ligase TRAIP n=1 Tax=Brachionus plicatilis TaxID=10195 RepID=A0A3M7Q1P1_BRAPC|nr:E3 ubiquitin- ligase TRAIP [Brachionus plicatilis]
MRPACVICTEIFVVNSHISACACGHIFHEECLFRWFSTSQKSCPQCRAKLKDSDVIKRLFLTESDSLPSTQSLTDFDDEHVKQKYEDLLNRYEQLKSDLKDKSESLNQKSKLIEQRDVKIKELDDFKSSHKKKLNENAVLIDYLKKELEYDQIFKINLKDFIF